MKIPSILVLLPLAIVSTASIPMAAQPAPAAAPTQAGAPVEVADVKFTGIRSQSGDTWLEASVEVNVKPGGRSVSGEFIDHVRVTFNLGVDLASEGAAKKRAYYRSSVEAVALEGGSKAAFRFYLPPELVKRDKLSLNDTAKYYVIELEVDGKPIPPARVNFSSAIKSEDSAKNFLSLVSSEGSMNEGVLIPQHLSPFAYDSQRRAPSVLRREGQR